MKRIQLYLSDIKELLQAKDFVSTRTCLREISPVDLADGWEHFTPEERVAIFRLSTRQKAVQVFEELDPPHQAALLDALQAHDAERLLEDLEPSQAGKLVRNMPQHVVSRLTGIMKKGGAESVKQALQYAPQSVGALMRSRYLTLEPRWNCKQALERIQLSSRLRHIDETHLDTLMAVDAEGRLLGTVSLKFLVVAPRDMLIRDLMEESPVTLSPDLDQEEAVKLFQKYKLKSAPVIQEDGRLLGVVVYRDIVDIAAEEVEEDFAKMAGFKAGLGHLSAVRQAFLRLPWLVITCLGGLAVSSVVKMYEGTLSHIIALATFSPLIAGMGGNVGSQTATIVVRALATGEIRKGHEWQIIMKEITVGVLLGLFYGLVVGTAAFFFYGARYGVNFALIVGSAMLFSIVVSSTMASIEPFILRRFGMDPATATGPLITTVTDLLSNFFYLSLATYLLLLR